MEEDRESGAFENSNDRNWIGIYWASVWHEVLGEVLHEVLGEVLHEVLGEVLHEVLIILNYW